MYLAGRRYLSKHLVKSGEKSDNNEILNGGEKWQANRYRRIHHKHKEGKTK